MLTIMVNILINKDIFEPSCDDLKFVVWNHNYFCANLNRSVYKTQGESFPSKVRLR